MKTNRHGKDNKRLLIATKSTLLLCSHIKILRSYKITRDLAWVDLTKISFHEPNRVQIHFKSEKLNLTIEDAENFLTQVINHLYQLFGEHFSVKLNIQPIVITPPEQPDKFLFAELFLSYCHSLNLPENEVVFMTLKNYQKNDIVDINLTKIKTDFKYLIAIIKSLSYGFNIRSLSLQSDSSTVDLFQILENIIKNNQSILKSLSIHDHYYFEGFDSFCQSLLETNINQIQFVNIPFSQNLFQIFFEILPKTNINILSFSKCQFYPEVIDYMASNISYFSKISSLSINETGFLSDSDVFNTFFSFLTNLPEISELELINNQIDISDVFHSLDQSEIPLTMINLSNNFCSNKFTGAYVLPVTLVDIRLRSVKWSPAALFSLLTLQNYVNPIYLDVSMQKELSQNKISSNNENSLIELHKLFTADKSLNISSFIWDYNYISTRLFDYLTNMVNIRTLSLNCSILDTSLDNSFEFLSFLTYLQNSQIQELSIRGGSNGSLLSEQKGSIKKFLKTLSSLSNLESIDISDNEIGDTGFELFIDFICKNKNIKRVSFDGNKLQNPQKFIEGCTKLLKVDHFEYLSKPKRDIIELSKKEDLLKLPNGAIENIWNEVKKKFNSNSKNDFEADIIDMIEEQQISIQTTSWDIDIQVPFNKEPSLWDSLRENYSLDNLIGVQSE